MKKHFINKLIAQVVITLFLITIVFQNQALAQISNPIITSPTNGQSIEKGKDLTVTWNSVQGAVDYQIVVGDPSDIIIRGGATRSDGVIPGVSTNGQITFTIQSSYLLKTGQYWICVMAVDSSGYTRAGYSRFNVTKTLSVVDTTPPMGSISINNGAPSTSSQNVKLSLNATDTGSGVGQMMVSNDPVFNGASWEPYATSKTWVLSSGNGTKYVFVKFKDNSGNASQYVASIELTVPDTTPAVPVIPPVVVSTLPAPTNFTATAVSSSTINLSWSAVSGATTYSVYRLIGGQYSKIKSVTTPSFSDYGLSANSTYQYVVKAANSAGESSPSYASGITKTATITVTTVPTAPTGLTATVVNSSTINLSWNAVNGATSYYIFRASSLSAPFSQIGTATVTSFSSTGLSAGATYYYRVKAVNSAGQSVYSGVTSATAKVTVSLPTVTMVATPTFSVSEGTYTSAKSVAILCATSGVTIRYTTNGSEPTSTSAQYSSPISIGTTMTLKAKAFKTGMADSSTACATYTISNPVTVISPPKFDNFKQQIEQTVGMAVPLQGTITSNKPLLVVNVLFYDQNGKALPENGNKKDNSDGIYRKTFLTIDNKMSLNLADLPRNSFPENNGFVSPGTYTARIYAQSSGEQPAQIGSYLIKVNPAYDRIDGPKAPNGDSTKVYTAIFLAAGVKPTSSPSVTVMNGNSIIGTYTLVNQPLGSNGYETPQPYLSVADIAKSGNLPPDSDVTLTWVFQVPGYDNSPGSYLNKDNTFSYQIHTPKTPISQQDLAVNYRTLVYQFPASAKGYSNMIDRSGKKYDIDPNLIACVINQESGFNQFAKSGVGAVGLMQLMPKEAQTYGVQDLTNPEQNIDGGTHKLKDLIFEWNNSPNVKLALAAYNAGTPQVNKWISDAVKDNYMDYWYQDWEKIKGYKEVAAETRNYVDSIYPAWSNTFTSLPTQTISSLPTSYNNLTDDDWKIRTSPDGTLLEAFANTGGVKASDDVHIYLVINEGNKPVYLGDSNTELTWNNPDLPADWPGRYYGQWLINNDLHLTKGEMYSFSIKVTGSSVQNATTQKSLILPVYYGMYQKDWAGHPYYPKNMAQNGRVISINGCGPTSMAMIVASLGNPNVTPATMADYSMDHKFIDSNYDTTYGLFNGSGSAAYNYGLKVKTTRSIDELQQLLSDGTHIAIASMGVGHFTKGGHLIALMGVSNEGGNMRIIVYDPNTTNSSYGSDREIIKTDIPGIVLANPSVIDKETVGSVFWIYSK
ncbi:exoglucanase B precursor [Desulfosporosinus acididurans]|uniref:Exoglucanase B n=1 Tax=Desulfosporosinus acididurans TaxID=476652 RepID=A0A0J1IK99_9FIRM|nr:transglycosylase SLT domain-containing protein [Desulfosporosinus acididurans]KLU65151.1 exoglucanase B precursor [Desulfosporosinus acididurans]